MGYISYIKLVTIFDLEYDLFLLLLLISINISLCSHCSPFIYLT